ncbi:helix-turn-helix transcriptional regulator [Leptolyngbya sp. 15MV]|nr:helix-turn-helix transcriptional regulator [Leptolyngbya sp. 15MV]
MTPKRMREIMGALHWSLSAVAKMTGRSRSNINNMVRGSNPVPADLARWLERAARWHETNPPPRRGDGA